MCSVDLIYQYLKAVSYTHLDVYKRQGLDGSQVCGYLPGRMTDPKEILSWLDPADVTIQYSLDRSGERQIYTLTTGSGAELLSYKQAAEILSLIHI